MFGLFVRFTCKDEAAAEAYDKLVAETIEAIKTRRAGNAGVRLPHGRGPAAAADLLRAVPGPGRVRGARGIPATRRYLEARGQYLASTEVDWLTLQTGKGTGG